MLAHRTFINYDDYVRLQGGKARGRRQFLLDHLEKNTGNFARIFRKVAPHLKAGPVLCLGARSGAESLGAERAGFAGSVGIDLHPVGPTVLRGDWHDLQFPDASFANAYTNSLDHCLHLDRFAAEVKRVLEPGGRFYLMATNRQTPVERWKGSRGKGNEAMHWTTSDDLAEAFYGFGFTGKYSWFDGKWGHYVFGVK